MAWLKELAPPILFLFSQNYVTKKAALGVFREAGAESIPYPTMKIAEEPDADNAAVGKGDEDKS